MRRSATRQVSISCPWTEVHGYHRPGAPRRIRCVSAVNELLLPQKQQQKVDDEEKHDGDFERKHPAVLLVGFAELVKVVEGFHFLVDGAVPVAQVKARRDGFVDARHMPVAEK